MADTFQTTPASRGSELTQVNANDRYAKQNLSASTIISFYDEFFRRLNFMVHKYNTQKWRCTRRFQYAKGWTGGVDFCKAIGLKQPKWHAALAQLVEHIIRNDGVGCSNHPSGTSLRTPRKAF